MDELQAKLQKAQNHIIDAIQECNEVMEMQEFEQMKPYRQAMIDELVVKLGKLLNHIEL